MSIKLIHFSVSSVFHFHQRRTISGNWNKGLLPTPQIRLEKTLGKWIGNMTNLPPQKNVVMIQISWNYVQYVQSQNIQSYTSYTPIFSQWSPQEVVHFPHLGSVTRGTEGHGPFHPIHVSLKAGVPSADPLADGKAMAVTGFVRDMTIWRTNGVLKTQW